MGEPYQSLPILEKLRLARDQLVASDEASPHAEIAALRFAGVGEAAVEALEFMHEHEKAGDELVTFECRSTCLYLLELGLEQAEMERSASWMRQLKDSELRQGVKKEVQFHRRRCASILAGGFLGVSILLPREPQDQFPAFDFSDMLNGRFQEKNQGVEYCKCLLSYFDSFRQLENIFRELYPANGNVVMSRKGYKGGHRNEK